MPEATKSASVGGNCTQSAQDFIGKEFYFDGDWQTQPGRWKVLDYDPEMDSYGVEALEPVRLVRHARFWGGAVRKAITPS